MKRYFLLSILFLISITIKPQTGSCFPDSFAMWAEVHYRGYYEKGKDVEYYYYGLLNKDTVINSIKYHKLYRSNDTIFEEHEYCGGIRQDSAKKVYYFGNCITQYIDTEMILMNLTIKMNDTIGEFKNYLTTPHTLIVKRIDTIEIYNIKRQRISFNIQICQWIEGIGNNRGLLWPTGDMIYDGRWNDLICFWQNGVLLYHNSNYPECIHKTDAVDNVNVDNGRFLVCPNPVTGLSRLNLSPAGGEFIRMEVYSMAGIKVKSISLNGLTDVIIKRDDYCEGMYLFRLTGNNNQTAYGKFIVQ